MKAFVLQKIADQLFSKTEDSKGDMRESSDEKKDEEIERESGGGGGVF